MKPSSSPRATFAAFAFGAGALLTVVPAPVAALSFAPASLRPTSSAACTVKSQFTVLKTIEGATNGDTFLVTLLDGGAFRGANGARTANVTGYLHGTTFQLTSQGASGYNYSLDGRLAEHAGTISGTGSDSDGRRFTFAINDGVTCTGGDHHTGTTPPPADHGNHVGDHDDKAKKDKDKAKQDGVRRNTAAGQGCPAAPAVANAYIKSMAAHGNRHRTNHGNVISRVARHMGKRNAFDGSAPCDADYATKVRSYVDGLHNPR